MVTVEMDETFSLYFALITAIGSVLMLAFGWFLWINGPLNVNFLYSCGFIAGCVIIAFVETETTWLLRIGGILIMTCVLAVYHPSFQGFQVFQKISSFLTGKDWTYKIYFDPEADKSKDNYKYINGRQLMTELLDLVGVDEDIKTVSLYKCPLSQWQFTMLIFYHKFVIFETKKWFWSIEKTTEAIIIRRSKKEKDVKDKRIGQIDKRIGQIDRFCEVVQLKSARGQTSVHELIKWLCDEHELYNKYHGPTTNCKGFANAVFDKVAMSWCYVIKFRPKASQTFISFKDSELMTKLVNLVDVNEDILNVILYKDPTFYGSRWGCIFQTKAWWWSIENRPEIMIITRNEKESDVTDYLTRKESQVLKCKSACGTKNVHDLIDWLYNNKEFKKLHSYIMLTTAKFANDVFDFVSERK